VKLLTIDKTISNR